MTTDLPGVGLEPVPVPLHGVELEFAGRKIYTHTLNATFMEAADWSTRMAFVNWNEATRSWQNNSGLLAAAYKQSAQIVVYNDIPAVMRTCNIAGLWPETINEVPLDGGASNLVTLQISFRYDFWNDI